VTTAPLPTRRLRPILNEGLYVLHALLLVALLPAGFFLSLAKLGAILGLHVVQLCVFKGCALSRLQQRMGGLQADEDFVRHLVRRLSGRAITESTRLWISGGTRAAILLAAFMRR
jgi:hypothetical protein